MKTTSQVTVITCDLCRKPREESEVKEVNYTKSDGVSHAAEICCHCILVLKRQLSLFNLTFWVKDGKGHFNSHAETAAFYVKGNML